MYITLWILIHVGVLFWILSSVKYVRGLRGDYGQGVWSRSSPFMEDALEDRRASILVFVILLIVDLLLLKS